MCAEERRLSIQQLKTAFEVNYSNTDKYCLHSANNMLLAHSRYFSVYVAASSVKKQNVSLHGPAAL